MHICIIHIINNIVITDTTTVIDNVMVRCVYLIKSKLHVFEALFVLDLYKKQKKNLIIGFEHCNFSVKYDNLEYVAV